MLRLDSDKETLERNPAQELVCVFTPTNTQTIVCSQVSYFRLHLSL